MNNDTLSASDVLAIERYMDRNDSELSCEEHWDYANALNEIREAQREQDDERYWLKKITCQASPPL